MLKKIEKLEGKKELSFQNAENVSVHSQYINYRFWLLYSLILPISHNMENRFLFQLYTAPQILGQKR